MLVSVSFLPCRFVQDVLFIEPLPLGTEASGTGPRGVHVAAGAEWVLTLLHVAFYGGVLVQGMMFMVCDGHAGVEAAKFATEAFHDLLCERLLLLPPDLPHPSEIAGEVKGPLLQSFSPSCPARKGIRCCP